ncbi:G patch domain-containing protein 1 [Neoarius graeffei]|uniref:G patch domain-containing protein 1 n=1 Tax=Neoarius graeffei TaxID=443677 RepID=UPI00298CAA3D|nr:G patch domain-containing protein 1 [Neoarius graeffei]
MASDGESDEDFVTYGTPLEPLEEDEPIRKPIPVQDQTVKDEKGRYKRFHGAFTGGFSAGYFNTVGSKEGWTPSTFVSSRNEKAEKHNARPEDFMDEEDFSEHGIAPQQITTTDDFASERSDQIRDKARTISSLTAPIPGDTLLEELIAPARSSIGVELLRKMGWKDGQGVGPRLKRRQRKQNPDVKVYGCALPPRGSEESEDDDEFAPENVTFAPKDVTPVDFTPKDDVHGLGYRGLDPLQAMMGGSGASHINLFTLDSDRTSLFGDRKAGQHRKGGISGQAFGVGAMEEEDDDIYHKDAMSNYDVILEGEEPGDGLYGWTAPQQYRKKKRDTSRDAAYVGKILEGFTLASKPEEAKPVFPPPVLPRDYRPVHYFRPVVDASSVSPLVAQALQASRGQLSQNAPQQSRHTLDSAQRREMLGETSLQGPRSVFELLDIKDRERLSEIRKAAEEKRAALQDRFQSGVAPSDFRTQLQVSKAQADMQLRPPASDTAQQALSIWSSPTAQTSQTFRPFNKDPSKQARYDRYISHLKQGNKDALESSLDPAMTEWERGRERDEFVRAAVLYKPSKSLLSSRFTRAKHEDDTDSVEVTRDQEGDVNDKQAAVKMKMFGKLTRDTMEWHPDKLLCRRFNVSDPYPGSSIVGLPKVKRDKFSVFNFLTVMDDRQSSQAMPTSSSGSAPASSLSSSGKRSRWDVADQGSKVKETLSVHKAEQEQDHTITATTSTASTDSVTAAEPKVSEPDAEQKTKKDEDEEEEEVRPPMDLFKAIFASSSDEKSSSSSEEDSGEEEEQEVELEAEPHTPEVTPTLPVVPQAPPTSRLSSVTEPESRIAEKVAQKDTNADLDCEEFGPRLPPPGQVFPSSSSPVWEEKQKKQSKARHKSKKEHKHRKEKKHKKKSKKHKHKGKPKKKKKTEETESSSDDSDGGGVTKTGSVSNEKLLQRLKNLQGKK